ncbi:MAG: ribosome small subunit-dependent GTPase A [Fibrobacteraceae bacterium]|nr:ribosome small subunit-dependent GTPase A [Fibrobacteraceae bacterium]
MKEKDSDENLDESSPRSTRRDVRSRRVNAMEMWKRGTIDDRPVKERWSREFKRPKVKKIKDPAGNFEAGDSIEGLVLEVHRRTCVVRLASGEKVNATYRPAVVFELGEFPVVGDRVVIARASDAEDALPYSLLSVQPRRSVLVRPGPKDKSRRELVLASNVDQVVVVSSAAEPPFNYGFADRFLLAANLCDLPLVMVLNKVDLLPEIPEGVRDFMSIVDKFISVSCKSGKGFDELKEVLKGKSSVLSGKSGVGKSSLVNTLVPEADLAVGNVRELDGKGRHTTTSSCLFDLPFGGSIIDTPGIRELGIMKMDERDLARSFPGFFPDGLFTCKYNDCTHCGEPGCAVEAGVNEGRIPKARYASYRRILEFKE